MPLCWVKSNLVKKIGEIFHKKSIMDFYIAYIRKTNDLIGIFYIIFLGAKL